METCEERKDQVVALSSLLGVPIPRVYREMLVTHGATVIYGLPVLGLPLSPDLDSTWGATLLLRDRRPDLPQDLIAIRLMDKRALCLQGTASGDAVILEVNLTELSPPSVVHASFAGYLAEARQAEEEIEAGLRRIEWLLHQGKSYEHDAAGDRPPFRAKDWRILRSCVHDVVVGLIALKFNEELNATEIGVFLTADHPMYQPGHAIRALVLLALSDAYRNGVTMELHFTRYEPAVRRSAPARIPQQLAAFAAGHKIKLSNVAGGVVIHKEAVDVYAAAVGIGAGSYERISQLEAAGRLTMQGICYLLGARIWAAQEASWILLNTARPEVVLFGQAVPEDRLAYTEALAAGRTAVAATRLWQKLGGAGNDPSCDCSYEPRGPLWIFRPTREQMLDWGCEGVVYRISAEESLVALVRPRLPLPNELQRILADAAFLRENALGNERKCLLYTTDFETLDLSGTARTLMEQSGIHLLLAPVKCRELNDQIDLRFSRARVLRK